MKFNANLAIIHAQLAQKPLNLAAILVLLIISDRIMLILLTARNIANVLMGIMKLNR